MNGFMRGFRLGVGLVGLGYGVYRLSQGKRDWMSTTALTSGLSLMAAGMSNMRSRRMLGQVRTVVNAIGMAPRFRKQLMRMAPQVMDTVRTAASALT